MVRRLLGLALLLSPLAAMPAVAEPWQLARSDVQEVAAPDGHRYRLLVAWPEGEPPPQGWPVLWLLDGEDNFAVATMTARRLARAGPRGGVTQGLIVAIESGPLARRVLDYTPAAPGYAIPAGAPASGLATGGADAFLDFVNGKLRPMVAARWRIDPARQTLAGHSFGGLLALHALFVRPQTATRYAAVSPSLWYGNDLLAREERQMPAGTARVLIASGSDERGPDGSGGAAAEALATRLNARTGGARYRELAGQDHGTTMLAAMGEIIRLAFGSGAGG